MTTYTDRIASKPLQVQSLNESARRGLVHALLTTYQPHMNNPLPPPPAWGEFRLRGWHEPSDKELISMHKRRLTDFCMSFCREFAVEVPVIPSGRVVDADDFLRKAKKVIETLPWSRVFDLLEFWMARYPGPPELADRLAERIDEVLKRENVDHRLQDKRFVPVADDVEKEAVATAMDSIPAVRTHIEKASKFIRSGDYRNSVQESIFAVEALCKVLTGKPKATMGDALKELGRTRHLHPALEQAYLQMYGWRGDEGGVGHALKPNAVTEVDYALARLILGQCAVFINYAELTLGAEPPVKTDQAADPDGGGPH